MIKPYIKNDTILTQTLEKRRFIFDIMFKDTKIHKLTIINADSKFGAFFELLSLLEYDEINTIIRLYIKEIKT
jgi:hypothetical protein